MSAALHGDLDSFKLPDVLNFLNGTRKTGMLTLTNAGREAYVFFREGNVVYAASNDESLRLGPMLIRKRKLSTIQAEEIDDLMLRSGGSWRDIAVQSGTFSATQIDELLKVFVAFSVAEWGDYFTRAVMPPLRVEGFNMSSVSQAS